MRVINEEKLAKLEALIKEYAHENNGDIPSLAVIMKHMDMVKSVAYRYMMTLKERGKINYSGKGTMELAGGGNYYRRYNSVKVPIYGSIICGSPEEEEQPNDDPHKRRNMTVFLFENDSMNWSYKMLLDEREATSYPAGCVCADGTVHVAYDLNRTTDREVYFARFTEKGIRSGEAEALRVLVSKAGKPEGLM